MPQKVQRPDYTGKKIHHSEEFELCYMRHRYLRRSTQNPTVEEMAPYQKIIKRTAHSQFYVYSHIFNAISIAEEDLVSIGMVHLVSYLNLFAVDVDQKRLDKFVNSFERSKFKSPTEEDILDKNKADFTSFLNQRMTDIVRLCTLKGSNITGKQINEYFPFFGPDYPKSISHQLVNKYEKMGYKKIDRIGYRAAKNKANVKEDKPFQWNDNWYFVVINEKSPLTYDDLAGSQANPFENTHQLNPEQVLFENSESLHWHKKRLQFDADSVDNKVRLITNFIETKKADPRYSDEVKTARRVLKELRK